MRGEKKTSHSALWTPDWTLDSVHVSVLWTLNPRFTYLGGIPFHSAVSSLRPIARTLLRGPEAGGVELPQRDDRERDIRGEGEGEARGPCREGTAVRAVGAGDRETGAGGRGKGPNE